jgi:hypothetical protein
MGTNGVVGGMDNQLPRHQLPHRIGTRATVAALAAVGHAVRGTTHSSTLLCFLLFVFVFVFVFVLRVYFLLVSFCVCIFVFVFFFSFSLSCSFFLVFLGSVIIVLLTHRSVCESMLVCLSVFVCLCVYLCVLVPCWHQSIPMGQSQRQSQPQSKCQPQP